MIQVGLLTETQRDEVWGQQYMDDSYMYPIQDVDDNWIMSQEVMEQCINPDFLWVKDLPLIEYKPKPTPPPFN